jgi:hypothetical protein
MQLKASKVLLVAVSGDRPRKAAKALTRRTEAFCAFSP